VNAIEVKDAFLVHSTDEGEAAALQGLSLEVRAGELLVIVGPSGSGKTSLLRALAGVIRPSTGKIVVFGEDVAKLDERRLAAFRRTTLGYLDQHYWRVLSPELPIAELVGLQLALRGWEREAWRGRAEELLAAVGLAEKADAAVGALSGGEQQRVALCAALAHHPPLLLADEPTGELGAGDAAQVQQLVRQLAQLVGCTTIVVTHDVSWRDVADRVVGIRDGRVSEELRVELGSGETLVVDERGWLRIPDEVRFRVGLGVRVAVESRDGTVVLRPVADARGEVTAAPASSPRATHRLRTPVRVQGLSKSFGSQRVFDGLDAEFTKGQLTVVTGPSGSGKTTLLRIIAGLEPFDRGEVFVEATPVSTLSDREASAQRRTTMAYVSQQSLLMDDLTALENVELSLQLRGLSTGAAEAALEQLALGSRSAHRLRRLSTGERARVALARAIAADPPIVLVDEPTSRLDEANARLVTSLLARMAREREACVICATHDPVVVALADGELSLAQ
jgi:ABC-type lipoprotein export system ATPase subunit